MLRCRLFQTLSSLIWNYGTVVVDIKYSWQVYELCKQEVYVLHSYLVQSQRSIRIAAFSIQYIPMRDVAEFI